MKFLLGLILVLATTSAFAQKSTGVFGSLLVVPDDLPSNCQLGDIRTNVADGKINYCSSPGTWSAIGAGGGSPGGSSGELQYNNSGNFGGVSVLSFDGSSTLTLSGTLLMSGLTATTPLALNSSKDVISGSYSGNTTKVVTTTGTLNSGDCVSIDSNGNFVDNGGICGTPGAVTSIGGFDSPTPTPSPKGLAIQSGILYAQSASTSVPGMINTGSQTFKGSKTFGSSLSDAFTIGAASSTAVHTINGGVITTVNTVLSTPYTVDSSFTDNTIFVDVASAATITLPTPVAGRHLRIQDISGLAATNNITISAGSQNILAPGSFGHTITINQNDGWYELQAIGSLSWVVVDQYATILNSQLTAGSDGQIKKSMGGIVIDSSYQQGPNPINYIGNSYAETSLGNWIAYTDVQTVTVSSASPAVATVTSTIGIFPGTPFTFEGSGTAATGTTKGTTYYVTTIVSGTTFNFSASLGGSNINTSGASSGTITFNPGIPITGGGGTPTGLTLTRQTSSPIRGSADFQLSQTNATVVQGQGASYQFNIDLADRGHTELVKFDYNATSTFVASSGQPGSDSDIEVFIYDVTNAVLVPVSPKVITANGNNNYFTFQGTFQTNSNSSTYRLILHAATANANATGWFFTFTAVYVGPQSVVYGSNITPWVQYTPTFAGFGTPSNVLFQSRRVGDSLEIQGYLTSGTSTSTPVTFTIGYGGGNSNVSIDSSAYQSSVYNLVGEGALSSSTAQNFVILVPPSPTNALYFGTQSSSSPGLAAVNGNAYISSGQSISIFAKVKILGWSSNSLQSNDAATRAVVAIYENAQATTVSTSAPINFQTKDVDTHNAVTTGSSWRFIAPVSGYYEVTAMAGVSTASAGTWSLYKNGSPPYSGNSNVDSSLCSFNGSGAICNGSIGVQLNAGDYVDIRPQSSSFTVEPYALVTIRQIQGPATISTTDTIAASYYCSTNQSGGTSSPWNFDTVIFDKTGAVTTGASWHFTAPVSGIYSVKVQGVSQTAGNNNVYLYKNGSAYMGGGFANASHSINFVANIQLNAGDYFDIRPDSTTTAGGGSLSSAGTTSIHILRVGNY